MKNPIIYLVIFFLLAQCQTSTQEKILYQSPTFTLFADKVTQGQNLAQVISPKHLKSNYKSPASERFSRLVMFKFSINQKDNEAGVGKDHWVVIGENEHESPLMTFGVPNDSPAPEKPEGSLSINYEYTFKVDMSPVTQQFNEKGYYEAFDGSKISKEEFKGFYIAGSAEPLTWDFVNLDNQGLKLQDTGKDNIYSITVKLNPYNEADYQEKEWKLTNDLTTKPQYKSEQPIVDALFNLSLEEAIKNIEVDSTFRTGAKWGGVWTRDISYSIILAFAYHEPEVAKISLLKKVKRNRIVQDTGSGGAYPISSDRMIWAVAAFEIYKTTGDMEWLKKVYSIIKNSVEDDQKVLFDASTGMFRGESSFLDWREQTYPKWMDNKDIYISQNLGTNVVHYQTNIVLAEMAKILGENPQPYLEIAEKIKNGINQYLWMPEKGFYAQYLYGRTHLSLSPRFEALGEALAVLFEVADKEKATEIFQKSPLTTFGVTCIYPQIPSIPPYHNNAIWPFVQAYWNLAAAKAGNEKALNHGLASIYRAAAFFLTNYENMVAQNGDYLGTEINSDRMLWSMAGNLAMVHRVFMGIHFETNGIRFQPVIPSNYSGIKSLSNFKYRKSILDITVKGFGNQISKISMDGKPLENAFFPAELEGKHSIEIEMNNQSFDKNNIQLVSNAFTLPNPQIILEKNLLKWEAIKGAEVYGIYQNGKLIEKVKQPQFEINVNQVAEYKVSAIDAQGVESFTSEPIWSVSQENMQIIEFENFAKAAQFPYKNYSGKGFVEISTNINKIIELNIKIEKKGMYLFDCKYSNGNGAWNTDNKCAIRSLSIDNQYIGTLVFPQRGEQEWSDWGNSNAYLIPLEVGKHTFKISFEEWNHNMNVETNAAMLDYARLIKVE
jgi:hypothetical protein